MLLTLIAVYLHTAEAMEASELEALYATAEAACDSLIAAVGDAAQREASAACLSALDALSAARVTTSVLSSTGVGKRLKKASKALAAAEGCADAAAKAKAVLDTWISTVTRASEAGEAGAAEAKPAEAAAAEAAEPAAKKARVAPPVKRVPPASTGNASRDKHRELLVAALRIAGACCRPRSLALSQSLSESEGVVGDALARAAEVEAALFEAFLPAADSGESREYAATGGSSSKDYKAKFRQLSFNLKDSKNPDLRRAVLTGGVGADELMQLSAEELARPRSTLASHRIALLNLSVSTGLRGAAAGQPEDPRARDVGVRAWPASAGARRRPAATHV